MDRTVRVEPSYVDGLDGQAVFDAVSGVVGFGHMSGLLARRFLSAGPEEVRRPRSLIIAASLTLLAIRGVSSASVALLSFITSRCARQNSSKAATIATRPLSCFGEYLLAKDLAGGHDRSADSRQLVGERHRDQALRLSRSQRRDPGGQSAVAFAGDGQRRGGADYQQFSDISIALLGTCRLLVVEGTNGFWPRQSRLSSRIMRSTCL